MTNLLTFVTAPSAQQRSRTEAAGLLARAALAVAAERMGGQAPASIVPGEEALRAEILRQVRGKLGIASDDQSDEALRAIESALDAEMEAVAEPSDLEAAMTRVATAGILTGHSTALIERERLQAHKDSVSAIAVTPNGRRAVSALYIGTLEVWDLKMSRLEATLMGHEDWVRAVAVTPDGRRAVSGSDDDTLKVWDLEAARVDATLEGHSSWVFAVAVTPDGKRAVSGSSDHTLKVWDLEAGRLEATLVAISFRSRRWR